MPAEQAKVRQEDAPSDWAASLAMCATPEDFPRDTFSLAQWLDRAALYVEDAAHACGYRAAVEEAAGVCREQAVVFGSDQYATGQPFSSFGERFACGRCEEAIRALGASDGGEG